jgi:hypothetical protein
VVRERPRVIDEQDVHASTLSQTLFLLVLMLSVIVLCQYIRSLVSCYRIHIGSFGRYSRFTFVILVILIQEHLDTPDLTTHRNNPSFIRVSREVTWVGSPMGSPTGHPIVYDQACVLAHSILLTLYGYRHLLRINYSGHPI